MLTCPGERKMVGSHLLSWKELQLGLETASGAYVPGADPLGSSQSSLLHSKHLPPLSPLLSTHPGLGPQIWGQAGAQGGREVTRHKVVGHGYLDQPGLQLVIDDDVVAVALKAVLVVVHHGLRGEDRG